MGSRINCTHRATRQVRSANGDDLITQCVDCWQILTAAASKTIAAGEKEPFKRARSARRLNAVELAAPGAPAGLFGQGMRIVSIVLGLVLVLASTPAAAAPPASWPTEWEAILYGAGGYDTIAISPAWSNAAGGYRAQIESGVVFRGDPIAGGLMHGHVVNAIADYDFGDYQQLDAGFCLARAGAGGQLDVLIEPGNTAAGYFGSCAAAAVPEPAAIAGAGLVLVLFKRRR